MKIKHLAAGTAFLVAATLSAGAYASQTKNVSMTFESGGVFSGVVTFADDFSSYSAVNGTLTGGTNGYNSAITWVWSLGSNYSSGTNNFSSFLMDGSEAGGWSNFIQFAYNYSSAPVLSFTSGVSSGGFDNYVNYIDPMVRGSIAAVPEPETYAMLLAGLGLMGVVARRRKAKQA